MMNGDQKKITFDHWLNTERGRYIYDRQKKLISDLTSPVSGEKVLSIGCGSGQFLQLFQDQKCQVTGLDLSDNNLKLARDRLGPRAELIRGAPDDLPFSDNEFDIVTLIYVLGTSMNPEKMITEAIRVSHRRVFLGFINNFSFAGTQQSIKGLFGFSSSEFVRFFTVFEMKSKVERLVNTPDIQWGSVIFFPGFIYDWFSEMDEMFPRKKNPFGAFAGMVFPVKYTLRTVQSPVLEQFDLNVKASAAAPEAVREMLRGVHQ